jgi:hypothetical protein
MRKLTLLLIVVLTSITACVKSAPAQQVCDGYQYLVRGHDYIKKAGLELDEYRIVWSQGKDIEKEEYCDKAIESFSKSIDYYSHFSETACNRVEAND